MYPHVMAAFYATPWAILPSKLLEIESFLRLRIAGERVPAERIEAAVSQRRTDGSYMVGRVGVVPIMGTIVQRASGMEQSSGAVSAERIGSQIQAMAADNSVKKILLHIDSPGGSVFGIQELVDRIRSVGNSKKIVAFADPMAASAAYWIASAAREIWVTPSGQVGSIGVIAAHQDESAADAAAGVKTTLITSSPYKAEGHPSVPLSDEAQSHLQSQVNHYDQVFTAAVARGRGVTESVVRKTYGQGRMVLAEAARAAGMVDRVGTLEEVLSKMDAPPGVSAISARARAVEVG